MDRRRGAKHSREPLPIGTLRVRWHNGHRVRYIKVANGGPPNRRWRPYARWLWERRHGPVPRGKRIIHLDGDTLNDAGENLAPAGPGDVMVLAHARDPEMSVRNRASCRAGTARHNRLRARINRHLRWLSTRWYAVYLEQGFAINEPHKSRAGLLRSLGVHAVAANGRILRGTELGFSPMRGREIAERFGRSLRKVDRSEVEL